MSVSTTIQKALIKTSEVLGADLYDGAGHKIASVRELFLDPASGQVHFAIVELSGLLGGGGKFHPIPFGALRWDAARAGYVTPFSKERLKAAPAYDRDQINSNAYGWDTQVQSYYAA